LLPLATLVIEADPQSGGSGPLGVLRAAFWGVVKNPVVMTIVVALVWRTTGLEIPGPLARLLDLLGPAGPPAALFCLGASLPRPRGWTDIAEVAIASVLKLAVLPVIVAGIARFAGVTGVAFAVVVITSALPTGANAFLLARRFHTMAEASASTVVVSTAVSIVSLTVLLEWLR